MANDQNQNLDDLEEKIKQQELEKTVKKEMPVTGRSVFDVQRIKNKKSKNNHTED